MNVEEFHNRLNELYKPPSDGFAFVNIPEIRYMAISGHEAPEQSRILEAAKWLFAIAHLVKPDIRKRMGKNFVEPPMECLFWADDRADFAQGRREKWKWKVMVVLVDWVSDQRFEEALTELEAKWESVLEPRPEITVLQEGRSVQRMHVGDYAGVSTLCDELYSHFLPENELSPSGPYHEIYLNDPARTSPEKRRIIVRQPIS